VVPSISTEVLTRLAKILVPLYYFTKTNILGIFFVFINISYYIYNLLIDY